MILMFKFLDEVQGVNSFMEVEQIKLVKGNAASLYFRIVQDRDSLKEELRYVPAAGATVSVKFDNLDSNSVITRVATQPFSTDDRSIWKVDILSTDTAISFNSMSLTLTEGAVVRNVIPGSSLSIVDTGSGRFFC